MYFPHSAGGESLGRGYRGAPLFGRQDFTVAKGSKERAYLFLPRDEREEDRHRGCEGWH